MIQPGKGGIVVEKEQLLDLRKIPQEQRADMLDAIWKEIKGPGLLVVDLRLPCDRILDKQVNETSAPSPTEIPSTPKVARAVHFDNNEAPNSYGTINDP